jgi:hypothetical protein
MGFPRGKFVKVSAIRISKSGKVDIKVPASTAKKLMNPKGKRRNVAAGFYDEDGYFHPIRASFDYSGSRAGDKPKKKAAKKKRAKAKRKR